MPDYLTLEEAAEITRRSLRTIHELTRRNAIPLRKLPHSARILVPKAELERFLDGAELEVIHLAGGGRVVRPKAAA